MTTDPDDAPYLRWTVWASVIIPATETVGRHHETIASGTGNTPEQARRDLLENLKVRTEAADLAAVNAHNLVNRARAAIDEASLRG